MRAFSIAASVTEGEDNSNLFQSNTRLPSYTDVIDLLIDFRLSFLEAGGYWMVTDQTLRDKYYMTVPVGFSFHCAEQITFNNVTINRLQVLLYSRRIIDSYQRGRVCTYSAFVYSSHGYMLSYLSESDLRFIFTCFCLVIERDMYVSLQLYWAIVSLVVVMSPI